MGVFKGKITHIVFMSTAYSWMSLGTNMSTFVNEYKEYKYIMSTRCTQVHEYSVPNPGNDARFKAGT